MHPRVLAERNARAVAEMRAAVDALAKKADIDPPELAPRRGNEDPMVYQLRERETIAAFLGDLAGTRPKTEPAPLEDDDAAPAEVVPQRPEAEPETAAPALPPPVSEPKRKG